MLLTHRNSRTSCSRIQPGLAVFFVPLATLIYVGRESGKVERQPVCVYRQQAESYKDDTKISLAESPR
jgi:hypothetical protein